MRLQRFHFGSLGLALVAAGLLCSCGGGSDTSGQSFTATSNETKNAPSAQTSMSCIDATQCSGDSILRTDNGVALTNYGVQVYGKSTSDLAPVNPNKTGASGLAPASGGIAEVRLNKADDGTITGMALILRNLGIFWDGHRERPPLVETFQNSQGRIRLNANGALISEALPPSSDLAFYDWAGKRAAGTQLNYANNRYFPRDPSNPPRCDAGAACPTTETTGLQHRPGNWQFGGSNPTMVTAYRLHEDGDIHAGDGPPDASGNPTILPDGNGFGVPHPGSKGERSFDGWSFQYANLGAWYTLDTVSISEWGGADEHNQNRRGIVAFGDVTDPARVPESGSATYVGFAHGWYAGKAGEDPSYFHGTASIQVDFATRKAVVTIQDTVANNDSATTVPVSLTATTTMGAAGTEEANYLTGPAANLSLSGGLSGRYFGPARDEGSGNGPAEIGGAFTLSNAKTGATGIGGFIARKQ